MLTNKTLNLSVNLQVVELKSFKEKSLGAIFSKKSAALFFNTRFGIHTFFMKHPLDIIVFDKKGEVVKFKENLAPNSFFFWDFKYSNVLELPFGIIKKLKLKKGHILIFNL